MKDWLQYTTKVGDCLEWQRCFNTDGYPRAYLKGNCNTKVHREVFFQCKGFYPRVVRHSCDNVKCINPLHLEAGDVLDNIRDCKLRGRYHKQVFKEELQKVKKLREQGLTYAKIAEELGIKTKRVEYIVKSEGYALLEV